MNGTIRHPLVPFPATRVLTHCIGPRAMQTPASSDNTWDRDYWGAFR